MPLRLRQRLLPGARKRVTSRRPRDARKRQLHPFRVAQPQSKDAGAFLAWGFGKGCLCQEVNPCWQGSRLCLAVLVRGVAGEAAMETAATGKAEKMSDKEEVFFHRACCVYIPPENLANLANFLLRTGVGDTLPR